MNSELIRVAKQHRPLSADAVVRELQKAFPKFQCLPEGGANSVLVKASPFAGARIEVDEKQIHLRGKVPAPVARALNIVLMGTISAATVPKVVDPLKRFLRERYAP